MTLHPTREHHTVAINHHIKAVECHWEASEHWQKDYPHAAYQAFLAHGHTLFAAIHGNEASKYYAECAECDVEELLKIRYSTPHVPAQSIETVDAFELRLSASEHHRAAAEHHNEAAIHHSKACDHFDRRLYSLAAQEAYSAYCHSKSALFHGNEATMRHIEHHSDSDRKASLTSESAPRLCENPADVSEKEVAPGSNVRRLFEFRATKPPTFR